MTGPSPDTDTGVGPDRAASTGTSRWQKVIGILGILVILWAGNGLVGQLTGTGGGPGGPGGGGGHSPGQDGPPAEIEEQETDTEDGGGHAPPDGGDG